MDYMKKFWPTPFTIKEKDITSFVVQLLVFVVVCAVVGVLIGVLAKIAIIGKIFIIVGGLMELYGLIGVILCVLKFLGLVK